MSLFALVDCNSFYVSSERVFQPQYEGCPVVVLSNLGDPLEQEKCKLLSELPGKIEFFFKDPVYNPEAVEKTLKAPDVPKILNGIKEAYAALPEFKEAAIEAATRAFAKANALKAGQVFHPVRVALSGRAEGPTLFRMIEYIGKEESLKRLDKALTLI